ncbi:MAG: 4-(cytidine 5'-diphospho)-2-C-methyl-D-erythritol kinase [Candidatus Thiodiazotropha sp. (ex Gloverina cf. vestifex)]|nr:4-(cytidine 5'-diphospho)-2-C-methyl-D-erythritol kinase [Candidatus Thiodiazotropha sp. (ex Gloverina cf. vestifex)]
MSVLTWPAPAKLNLMLRITGRRPDGYHTLQTVFQFLDTGDELDFHLRDDGQIHLDNPIDGVPATSDLCYQAAIALQQRYDCKVGATIELRKNLPMGGGLGGGSSDAATTLVALNQLWGCGLESHELQSIGLQLGADVPIFIHGQAAWAEGVGDKFIDIDPPTAWYLVLIPDCHVSTAEIFSQPDLTRHSPGIKIRDFLEGDSRNDCLPVVRLGHPKVAEALDWLNQFAAARLTGTGACVFAAFADEQHARAAHQQLPAELEGFVARGINRSPLLERLQHDEH